MSSTEKSFDPKLSFIVEYNFYPDIKRLFELRKRRYKVLYLERKPRQPYLVFMRVLYPQGRIEFGGRKTEEPGEKPSEQGRELTTNSTYL